jgi:transposase-like protein
MMMPPNAMSVAQVSRETGVSEQTLYNWRNRFQPADLFGAMRYPSGQFVLTTVS